MFRVSSVSSKWVKFIIARNASNCRISCAFKRTFPHFWVLSPPISMIQETSRIEFQNYTAYLNFVERFLFLQFTSRRPIIWILQFTDFSQNAKHKPTTTCKMWNVKCKANVPVDRGTCSLSVYQMHINCQENKQCRYFNHLVADKRKTRQDCRCKDYLHHCEKNSPASI